MRSGIGYRRRGEKERRAEREAVPADFRLASDRSRLICGEFERGRDRGFAASLGSREAATLNRQLGGEGWSTWDILSAKPKWILANLREEGIRGRSQG
jgi:hypothetical protein